MATRVVTYKIGRAMGPGEDFIPWINGVLLWELVPGSYDEESQFPNLQRRSYTDENGEGSIGLWCNSEGTDASVYRVTLPSQETFTFTLSPGVSGNEPIDLQTLRALGAIDSDWDSARLSNAILNNPDLKGPQGDPGVGSVAKEELIGVVEHGADPDFAIPPGFEDYHHIQWIGTVLPNNFRDGDEYVDPDAPALATAEELAAVEVRVTANEATLDDHETRITDLEDAPGGGGAVETVNDVEPDGNGNVELTAADVGADPAGTAAGLVATEAGTRAAADTALDSRVDALEAAPPAHTHTLSQITDAGTAASRNVATSGNASSVQVVKGDDTRLSDSRAPTAHTHPTSEITGLDAALASKIPSSEKGAASGVAPLDSNSKISAAYLPAIAVTDVSTVASEAAQLALTAEEGDVAVRSDTGITWIHNGGSAGTMADWTAMPAVGQVASVFGRVGAVTATDADYNAGQVVFTPAGTIEATRVQAAIEEAATDAAAALATHTGNTSNPHGVTKSQVGLGNVDNYATASQAEAEAGTSNTVFMTALRVWQSIVAWFATVISPAQLTANTDNYAPSNLATSRALRLSTDASRNLTGIAAPAAGELTEHIIVNVGSFDLVLKHDVTSTAANRFYAPGSVDFTLVANSSVLIRYDSTSSRWRIISGNRALNLVDNTSNATERAAVRTLTNARITPRVLSLGSGATPSINTDLYDVVDITGLTVDITSMTSNLTGTPTNNQPLRFSITGTASRGITWGSGFEEGPNLPLPTTTSGTDRLDAGFFYNAATSKFRIMAVN